MSETLQLNLIREHFDAIAEGRKRVEYRQRSAFFRARLEGRKYDLIRFRNGYTADAPEMLVEFRGMRRYGTGHNAYYAILLGRVLKVIRRRKAKTGQRGRKK
jgi:ASC-1-like (ASCH) protein